jgi:hypothetical protein
MVIGMTEWLISPHLHELIQSVDGLVCDSGIAYMPETHTYMVKRITIEVRLQLYILRLLYTVNEFLSITLSHALVRSA